MATITSVGTGAWGTAGTWNAGVPADNDTVVIAAGHTVTFDVDQSGFANGIAGLTITSHATTPGMLVFKHDADGTYHLKIKTATTIAGTNAAAKGRLLANSDGVWGNTGALAFGRKAIIDLAGTGNISALYLDIALYCTQPTNLSAEVYGTCYVVTCEADDDKLTFVSPSTTPPQAGTPVTLSGTLPAELTAGTTYYVVNVSGSTCKLEATIGGGAINLTDDGSGTILLHYGKWGPVAQATNVNTTTGVITWDGVPPDAGTAVVVRSSGTLPTGLSVKDCYYVRTVSGNTCNLALKNSDGNIVIPSAVGSGNISMFMGGAATTTANVNVAADLTGDAGWVTTDGHDHAVLADTFDFSGYDQQRLQLTTIAARYLVLSANVNSAQYPGALVWLMSRNVSIRSATTTIGTNIVDYGVGTHSGVFQCEIRATAGTGTTFYGSGVKLGTGHTISGTVSGCNSGVSEGVGHTISGTISGCSSGVWSSTGSTISGTVSGCSTGVSVGGGHTISGTVSGCTNGVSASTGHTISGTVSGCTSGVKDGTGHTISGTVSGCNSGVSAGVSHTISGTVSGCTTGVSVGKNYTISGTVSGCTTGVSEGVGYLHGVSFSSNETDITINGGYWQGCGVTLAGATQVGTYKHSSIASTENRNAAVAILGLGGVSGSVGFWTLGGFTKTATYAVGTHGTPPVASDLIHESTFEDSDRVNWVEFTIWGTKDQAVTVTFYGKLTGTAAWMTRPSIGIYDPTKGWQAVAEVLNASAAMAANTDWQTLSATYTPTYDRELRVRMQGVGGNAGGTGTEQLYWFAAIATGSAGGGGNRPAFGDRSGGKF